MGERQAGMVYVQPELPLAFEGFVRHTRCGICGRALTNPRSIALGIGPVCLARYVPELAERRPGKVSVADKHSGLTDVFLHEPHIREAVVIRRNGQGTVETNVPHAVVHHSPTGYEYGYVGSGPGDLALNICEIAVAHLVPRADHKATDTWDGVGCSYEAWIIHNDLMHQALAGLDQDGSYTIPWEEVVTTVRRLLDARADDIAAEYGLRRAMREMEERERL